MLNDKKIYKSFEQKLSIIRWLVIFISIFSLDTTIYVDISLFEEICSLFFIYSLWNIIVYLIAQKTSIGYEHRYIMGGVEIVVDLLFLTCLAKVFGIYGDSSIYIFHLGLSIVAYIRYMNFPVVWGMQALIVANMCIINGIIFEHYYSLKSLSFQIALVLVVGVGMLFRYVLEEYARLQMLVDVQKNDVAGLERNIKEMNNLNEMSQVIFESQCKEGIMKNLLENIQKATKNDSISLFLYGENGVESDAKLYHYRQIKYYYGTDPMPYEVVYNQNEIEKLRQKREYRLCILNYEPIVIASSFYKEMFKGLLGEELGQYIYLFNIMNKDESTGIVICNVNTRLDIETCKMIDKMVENVGLALFKTSLLEKERSKSVYDTLTGVKSRVSINETLPMMIKQVCEEHAALGVLFIDIDNFKKFNDTYGHSIGDIVLREVAKTLNEQSPVDSLVGRYGGEEFLVVFYDVDAQKAMELAEHIRKKVSEIDLKKMLKIDSQITISIGVSLYPRHAVDMNILVEYADQAMYEAKKEKNKVCLYEEGITKGVKK